MTSFFADHYALAIAVSVIAGLFVILGLIAVLLSASDKLLRGRELFGMGVVGLVLVSLAVPAMQGANRADDEEDAAIRAAVLTKYDVSIEKWGDYRGRHSFELASLWKINGQNVSCTVLGMEKPTDEVLFVCGGSELPRRGA